MTGIILFNRLNGNTAAANRIYPLILPQDATFPAVTYQNIFRGVTHLFGEDSEVSRFRIQVNSWAPTYSGAVSLAEEVKALLSRFKGTINGVVVQDIVFENELDVYEDDTNVFTVLQEYLIFTEAP